MDASWLASRMTGLAIPVGKRRMLDRKSQGPIRSAVGIVTGDTPVLARKNFMMPGFKGCRPDVMTLDAEASGRGL